MILGEQQAVTDLRVGERPANDLRKAAANKHVFGAADEPLLTAQAAGAAGAVQWQGRRERIKAVDSCDLFN